MAKEKEKTATEAEAQAALAAGDPLPSGWSYNAAKDPPLWQGDEEPPDAAPTATSPADQAAASNDG